MSKTTFTTMTTPKGEALYAYLTKPEVYEGKEMGYSIQMKFSEEDTQKMKEAIQSELEAAKASPDFKGKKWSAEPFLGYKEKDDGDVIFKFKMGTEYKMKTGEVKKRVVPVFDSNGHVVKDAEIGNGSIVRVNFSMIPFNMNPRMNGISMRLNAVQIVTLVPYGQRSAEQYGFGNEEGGYTVPEETEYSEDAADDGGEF